MRPRILSALVATIAVAGCGGDEVPGETRGAGREFEQHVLGRPDPTGTVVIDRYPKPVDLRAQARSARFRQAVADFEASGGGKRVTLVGLPGAAAFRASVDEVEHSLDEWRRVYRPRGTYVLLYDDAETPTGVSTVLLLPTRDQFEVLRAVGTDGINWELTNDDVVRRLRALHRSQPFELTAAGIDTVEGRFLTQLHDADALARRFYRLCPDIVDQGTVSVAKLADELRASRTLFCWWD